MLTRTLNTFWNLVTPAKISRNWSSYLQHSTGFSGYSLVTVERLTMFKNSNGVLCKSFFRVGVFALIVVVSHCGEVPCGHDNFIDCFFLGVDYRCATLNTLKKSWTEARDYCDRHKYKLVKIDSATVQQTIEHILNDAPVKDDVWIGLSDGYERDRDEGVWRWLTYTKMIYDTLTYSNWGLNRPEHAGAGMIDFAKLARYQSWKWHDAGNSENHHFICEYVCNDTLADHTIPTTPPPLTTTTVSTTPPPSTTTVLTMTTVDLESQPGRTDPFYHVAEITTVKTVVSLQSETSPSKPWQMYWFYLFVGLGSLAVFVTVVMVTLYCSKRRSKFRREMRDNELNYNSAYCDVSQVRTFIRPNQNPSGVDIDNQYLTNSECIRLMPDGATASWISDEYICKTPIANENGYLIPSQLIDVSKTTEYSNEPSHTHSCGAACGVDQPHHQQRRSNSYTTMPRVAPLPAPPMGAAWGPEGSDDLFYPNNIYEELDDAVKVNKMQEK